LAGFVITPTHHYRTQQVLHAFGVQHLGIDANQSEAQLDALKYRLAPIFATNETEQEQFYGIFGDYIKEISKVETFKKPNLLTEELPPEREPLKWYEKIPLWLWMVTILGLAILVGLQVIKKKDPIKTECKFQILQKEIAIGDTLKVNNQTNHDTSRSVHYSWEIKDGYSGAVEHRSEKKDLKQEITKVKKGKHQKHVHLTVYDTSAEGHYIKETIIDSFKVICQNRPALLVIKTDFNGGFIDIDETIQFSLKDTPEKNVRYEWDFGDGKTKQVGTKHSYKYEEEGVYKITVRASKDTLGFCETIFEKSIAVGKQQAPLTFKAPIADEVTPTISFSKLLWCLFGLLPFLAWAFYFWRENKAKAERLAAEQARKKAAAEKVQKDLASTFAAPDKAPYFIPYQNNDGLIRMATETYRMADILRARQEGLRMELDIPTTIQQTIEKGGFPEVAFRQSTMPSEYLFLLDEKEENSHQKRLFQFLTQFLRDKDIHLEVFWYREQLHHFWNKQTPKGIKLEGLRRAYPDHKLVMMGDGHSLLKSYGGENLLRPEFSAFIAAWKHRVLLTPQPVSSWTYREQVLSDLILPFPADITGFKTALPYLDMDQEELAEQIPAFDKWETFLRKDPPQPDVNYKKWRKLKDYKKYLANRADLYRWLCALAVHPHPNWELTIAIGRALETEQTPLVTYDNLLVLSHIPWLQGQDLPPKIRTELLKELNRLDPAAEPKARKAVQAALNNEAVKKEITDSHANYEWQSETVFQQFALAPNDVANNRKLRYLLDKLSKRQELALTQSLEQHRATGRIAGGEETANIGAFLQQSIEQADRQAKAQEEELPTKKRGWWLYFAFGMTVLTLLVFLWMFLRNNTDWLYEQVKGQVPEPVICSELDSLTALQNLFFIQNCAEETAAIKLNNVGVKIWKNEDRSKNPIRQNTYAYTQHALDTFGLAIEAAENGRYPLAQENAAKMTYNLGIGYYNTFFEEEQKDSSLLGQALPYFNEAEQQAAIQLDSWHAIGLVSHYQNRKESAKVYLDKILAIDSTWFDSLKTLPHLQSLITEKKLIPIQTLLDSIIEKNITGVCRKITNVNYNLSLRNSRLNQRQLNKVNQQANAVNNVITRIPLNAEVQLLDSVDNYYAVRYQGQTGWIVKFNNGNRTLHFCNINKQPNLFSSKSYLIRGVVKNQEGTPIKGVRVRILENSSSGVVYTQANGSFNINFKPKQKLTFPFTNKLKSTDINLEFSNQAYSRMTQRVPITGNKTELNVILKSLNPPKQDITKNNIFTDPRDNQTYRTVTIGKQTWFAQNLNYQTSESWCYLELPEFCEKAGRLYTWEAAKKACPKGWHLPTNKEWKILLNATGGYYDIETGNSIDDPNKSYQTLIKEGNNNFAALLSGAHDTGEFDDMGTDGYYWSESEYDDINGLNYSLGSEFSEVYQGYGKKKSAFSCRCLKD